MTFIIDLGGLQELKEAALLEMDHLGRDIADEYRDDVGIDTGELKASIRYERAPGSDTGMVYTDVEHAKYHEFGTRPHTITAKPGGVLAFPGAGGEMVFRKSVKHPGTAANPAFRRAAFKDRNV